MSDTEPDIDLDMERYDSEDNLNYYGSPIYQSPSRELVGAEQALRLLALKLGHQAAKLCDRTQVSEITDLSRSFTIVPK